MNEMTNEGQDMVAPGHRAETSARPAARARRVLGTAAVVIATAVVVVLPVQSPAAAAPTPGAAQTAATSTLISAVNKNGSGLTQATYETRLRVWINRTRNARHIRAIIVRPCHDGFAERWTDYLTRNGQFRHQDLGRYMTRCKLSKAGEILALGSVTPHQMVRMWMNSPEHRRIMLDGSFGLTGIAARRDANGNWIGCIDFGRRM